jgi:hypothetical protein
MCPVAMFYNLQKYDLDESYIIFEVLHPQNIKTKVKRLI